MSYGRTVVHAIIGAVVAVVLSFIPFSTVLGGAVSGFLEGTDEREGAIAGAIAGAITFLPFAALVFLVLGILGFGFGVAGVPLQGFAVGLFALAFIAGVTFVYTVGLSALGGFLGALVAREYPEQQTRTRETIGMGGSERPPRDYNEYDRSGSTASGGLEGTTPRSVPGRDSHPDSAPDSDSHSDSVPDHDADPDSDRSRSPDSARSSTDSLDRLDE